MDSDYFLSEFFKNSHTQPTHSNLAILPAGVFAVQGEFLPGSTVSVIDKDAHELARGLVHYSSAELEQIKGCNSGEIANILGHKNFDEVIHRDDLVIL